MPCDYRYLLLRPEHGCPECGADMAFPEWEIHSRTDMVDLIYWCRCDGWRYVRTDTRRPERYVMMDHSGLYPRLKNGDMHKPPHRKWHTIDRPPGKRADNTPDGHSADPTDQGPAGPAAGADGSASRA